MQRMKTSRKGADKQVSYKLSWLGDQHTLTACRWEGAADQIITASSSALPASLPLTLPICSSSPGAPHHFPFPKTAEGKQPAPNAKGKPWVEHERQQQIKHVGMKSAVLVPLAMQIKKGEGIHKIHTFRELFLNETLLRI